MSAPSSMSTAGEETGTLVVGAGLAGLACAHALARAGTHVRVCEASAHAGGVVGSIAEQGFCFETGPNTVQASSAEFRALADELGLASRFIVSSPSARQRSLWFRGKLHALPSSPFGLVTTPLLSLGGKFALATEPLRRFRPAHAGDDPDLATFFTERLGAETATRLAGAFVRGVYAAELAELGARSAFPRVWDGCVKHGGLVRWLFAGRKTHKPVLPGPACSPFDLLSFPGGLGEFTSALANSLGTRLSLSNAVLALERADAGWRAHTQDGETFTARHVVLAVPAPAAATLLARMDGARAAAETLARIAHARVTLVHLGLAARDLAHAPRGFGFLVPPDAGSSAPHMLGTICGSNIFAGRAPAEHHAVTSFYASADLPRGTDRELADFAARDLATALGLTPAPTPVCARVLHWDGVIPRYASGHRDRMTNVERELAVHAPGLTLAGSYTGGVSVEQVIARGRAVARRILVEAT